MPYGTIKVDNITFTNGGSDSTITVSGIVEAISGNITATGTIQGATIIGTSTVSGATVTGNTGQFTTLTGGAAGFTTVTGVSGIFTSQISGATVTGSTASFTSGTFVSGIFTTQISGATITGNTGNFTTFNAGTANLTSGVFASGTQGAPSLSIGTTTNGLYSPGADQVAISTGGSGRLFVGANGDITLLENGLYLTKTGLGNGQITFDGNTYSLISNSSSARLILGTTSTERLSITSTGTVNIKGAGSAGSTQAVSFDGSAPVDSLVLTSGGLLGVGTSSPSYTLDVAGTNARLKNASGSVELVLSRNSNSAGASISLNTGDTNKWFFGLRGLVDDKFYFYNNVAGNTALTIDESSGVGVGTTAPNSPLDVVGSSRSIQFGSATRKLYAWSDTGGISLLTGDSQTGTGLYFDELYHTLRFATGSTYTERMRIDSSGRLLVGTSSAPTAGDSQYGLIRIQGNTSSASGFGAFSIGRGQAPASIVANSELGHIYFTANDGSPYASVSAYSDAAGGTNDYPGRLVFSTTADGASSPTERMRISSTGKTQLFADASDNALNIKSADTAGTSNYLFSGISGATSMTSGGSTVFAVFTNGNVVNTNNSYGAISDIKLKENIVDASSQWSDIKALQVRNYNFKEGQTHTQLGLIAQEVELVSPGLVSESPDRDEEGNDLGTVTKSVNYSVLYMKAVKALQEAMERIETLEAKVAALESA